jgi:metal-responsive CopG/Arc/MetJ family transcriptional regulator
MLRLMARLHLTLDEGTSEALARHARREGKPRAALAREAIREAIARREALESQRKIARDYAAGRSDAKQLLKDLEAAQLGLLDREDA